MSKTSSQECQFHPNFTVFIDPLLYCELISLLKDPNTNTGFIYRKLMFALIPNTVWSSETGNSTTIKDKYPNEYGASQGN